MHAPPFSLQYSRAICTTLFLFLDNHEITICHLDSACTHLRVAVRISKAGSTRNVADGVEPENKKLQLTKQSRSHTRVYLTQRKQPPPSGLATAILEAYCYRYAEGPHVFNLGVCVFSSNRSKGSKHCMLEKLNSTEIDE